MTQSPDSSGGPPTAGQSPGSQQEGPPATVPPPGAWHFPAEPAPPAGQAPPAGGPYVPYGTSPHYGSPPYGGQVPHGTPGQPYGTPGQPYGTPGQPYGTPGQQYGAPYGGGPAGQDRGLAEWWRRLLARVIDVLAVAVVLLPISVPMLSPSFSRLQQVASQYPDLSTPAAQSAFTSAEGKFLGALWTVSLIAAGVWFLYDSIQHARWGQTLGKRALSTRVVSAYDGSPVSTAAAVRRAAVYALIPVVPVLGTFFSVLNELWLLWDRRRQCLHDKAAHTIVVKAGVPGAGPGQQRPPW